MKEQFYFQFKTKTNYGFGYSRNLPAFLAEHGFSKVVLMVHEGVAQHSDYYQEIVSLLVKSVEKLTIEILRGNEEPDYDYLDEIAKKIRAICDVDVIVGIGGGSCLDIAKAVALLKTNPGKGLEYRGFDHGKVPGVPVIAIPTTAGSGSEATINAVFTNKHEKKKLGINGINMDATYAILDAEWTLSCPFSAALSSGLDALVHSMESFMCHQANPLTRMYSREAFRLLYFALPCLVEDPTNRDKRQQLILASYIAATGLFNSGSESWQGSLRNSCTTSSRDSRKPSVKGLVEIYSSMLCRICSSSEENLGRLSNVYGRIDDIGSLFPLVK